MSSRASAGEATAAPNLPPAESHLAPFFADQTGDFTVSVGPPNGILSADPDALGAKNTAPAIFVLHRGRVVDSIRKTPTVFGARHDQIVAELESALRDSPVLRDHSARVFGGEEITFHWHRRRPDGSRLTIEASLSPIEVEGHARVLAVLVDLTPDLTGRLLERQDAERRRVARQLHNHAGQNLSALNINLSLLSSAGTSHETLQEAIELAEASIREIRKLSYELHPPLLDELGLVSALRAYVDAYSTSSGIQVQLNLPAAALRLPPAVETGLFRILEEGLVNIHRHSGSKTATLLLKFGADRVELELVDFGIGLPMGGVGIACMRERARQLGGWLTIASGPHGTTLHVVIPV